MRAVLLFLSLVIAVSPAAAQYKSCATGPETLERARELGEWSRARSLRSEAQAKETSPVVERNGIYIIDADPTNAPFFHPVDLEGRTIVLDRRDDATFMSSTAPLAWDAELGDPIAFDVNGNASFTLGFDFPFFNQTVRKLYVSPRNAL